MDDLTQALKQDVARHPATPIVYKSHCADCGLEMPLLTALFQQYPPKSDELIPIYCARCHRERNRRFDHIASLRAKAEEFTEEFAKPPKIPEAEQIFSPPPTAATLAAAEAQVHIAFRAAIARSNSLAAEMEAANFDPRLADAYNRDLAAKLINHPTTAVELPWDGLHSRPLREDDKPGFFNRIIDFIWPRNLWR